jgi:hypothetical protein
MQNPRINSKFLRIIQLVIGISLILGILGVTSPKSQAANGTFTPQYPRFHRPNYYLHPLSSPRLGSTGLGAISQDLHPRCLGSDFHSAAVRNALHFRAQYHVLAVQRECDGECIDGHRGGVLRGYHYHRAGVQARAC